MPDCRIETLAKTIVTHSVDVKPDENVIILYDHPGAELALAVAQQVFAVGGHPFPVPQNQELDEAIARQCTGDELSTLGSTYAGLIDKMDCFIQIDSPENTSVIASLPVERRHLLRRDYTTPINAARGKKKWIEMIYPSPAMAQLAGMSFHEFKDYYFRVTNIDYEKLGRATDGIRDRMCACDKIHVLGADTDLTVSLKGFMAITANGFHNLPDGEIASTPARESMNGHIKYNVPTLWNGYVFKDIALTFKDGKVVDAVCNNTERFLEELSIDMNSMYIGEFSFGTNPYINRHITNIIFDEKMTGSLHMALGACYNFPGRDNGNRSYIHWDLIHSHLPQYGGGEIWMDDELIRKDGIWLPEDLRALNPDVFETL